MGVPSSPDNSVTVRKRITAFVSKRISSAKIQLQRGLTYNVCAKLAPLDVLNPEVQAGKPKSC